jgi:hypothetical protein
MPQDEGSKPMMHFWIMIITIANIGGLHLRMVLERARG